MNAIPKILIVDDIKAAHQLYKQALKSENYEIFDAERGQDAISTILTNNIDLVILDLNLPDMSGIEVLEEIRKKRESLPVIVLTSYGMKEMVVRAASMGINYYLVKPVDMELFRSRIRSVLNIPDNEKLNKLTQQSRDLIEELTKLSVDESLSQNVMELKNQIKEIATKLQNLEKEQIEKSKLEEVIWKKEVTCPICASTFITNNYRTKTLPIVKKESDFHEIYEVINPIAFDMWVCPECLYTAKKEDFENIDVKLIEKIARDKSKRKKFAGEADFRMMRDYDMAILSYQLAFQCYDYRKPSSAFLGSLYLKVAWLAREQGNRDLEVEFMKKVIEHYEKSLSIGEKIGGQLSELGLIYLLGELYRRIGDTAKAGKYFMKVRQDPDSKNEKAILRMAAEQMDLIKDEKKGGKHG